MAGVPKLEVPVGPNFCGAALELDPGVNEQLCDARMPGASGSGDSRFLEAPVPNWGGVPPVRDSSQDDLSNQVSNQERCDVHHPLSGWYIRDRVQGV